MVSFVLKSPKIYHHLKYWTSEFPGGGPPDPPPSAQQPTGRGCESVTIMLLVTLLGLSPYFLIVSVTVIYKSAGWCSIRLYQSPRVGLCLDLCS